MKLKIISRKFMTKRFPASLRSAGAGSLGVGRSVAAARSSLRSSLATRFSLSSWSSLGGRCGAARMLAARYALFYFFLPLRPPLRSPALFKEKSSQFCRFKLIN